MTDATPTGVSATPVLAEDVLLLLFSPQSGVFRGEGSALFHTLAGAVLTDLALQNQVQIDDRTTLRGRQVRAVGRPPADPLLRTPWERIANRPTDVHSLILEIGPGLRQTVIDRLVERGQIRIEKRKFLGLFPSSAVVDGGSSRRNELLDAVRPVLIDGTTPDVRTGALTGLLSASGQLPALDPDIRWSGAVYTRGVAMQKGEWGASAAAEAVARTTAAILTTSLFLTFPRP
jgi:hypothetical protein